MHTPAADNRARVEEEDCEIFKSHNLLQYVGRNKSFNDR